MQYLSKVVTLRQSSQEVNGKNIKTIKFTFCLQQSIHQLTLNSLYFVKKEPTVQKAVCKKFFNVYVLFIEKKFELDMPI